MKASRAVVGIAVTLVAVAASAVLLTHQPTGRHDGGGSAPRVSRPGSETVASELTALLRKGAGGTFHAAYTTSVDHAVAGGRVTMESWHKGGHTRQDTTLDTGREIVVTASFQGTEGSAVCSHRGDDPWSCRPSTVTRDELLTSTVDQLTGARVTGLDATVSGRKARCFTVQRATGSTELCATSGGVVVSLRSGSAAYHLTELSPSVPDNVFTLPAAVSAA